MAWQPRSSGMGMHWDMNLDDIAQLIGTIYGAAKVVKTNVYIDSLMRAAHSSTARKFNEDIAAAAVASQNFNHMYEWGTAGINKGRTTRRFKPTDPEAMLWTHRLSGGKSSNKGIDFKYRASKVPVPQPTTAKTKVARQDLDRLSGRKYIFYWKAPIIEQGMQVMLRPKYAKAIFVPFYGQPRSPNLTDEQRKRGYLFHKGPLRNVPSNGSISGVDLKGNFTQFWEIWWNGTGSKMIGEEMYRMVDGDFGEAVNIAAKKGTRRRGKSWKFEIMTAERETEAFMEKRVQAQQIKERMESETW